MAQKYKFKYFIDDNTVQQNFAPFNKMKMIAFVIIHYQKHFPIEIFLELRIKKPRFKKKNVIAQFTFKLNLKFYFF